jgi:hypothetical protein
LNRRAELGPAKSNGLHAESDNGNSIDAEDAEDGNGNCNDTAISRNFAD